MKRMKLLYLPMLIVACFCMMACSDDDVLEQSSWYGEQIIVEFTHGGTECRIFRYIEGLYSTNMEKYPVAWRIKGKSFVLYDKSIMDDNTIWEGNIEGNNMTLTHHQSQTTYNLKKK